VETATKVSIGIIEESLAPADDSRVEPVTRHQDDAEAAAILRAQTDPAAFEDLYLLYRDRLYLYLLRRTGNAEDASDLTQQVFIRMFRSIGRYGSGRGPFAAWVFTIARNAHRSFATRRQPQIAWDVSPEEVGVTSDFAKAYPTSDGLDRLTSLLTQLTPKEQELIHLRFEIDLSISQIAAIVGMSDEATKKAVQRTLKKLKDMYHDRP
jgi:RNA polymerase sigma-70 factor (ECF subfamily)